MTSNHPARIAVFVAATLLGSALAAAQVAPGAPEITVRTGSGLATFQIQSLEAPRSAAARVNLDRVGKAGVVPLPTQGFTLFADVVVESADRAFLEAMSLGRGAERVEPVAGSPGFHLVRAASLAGAVELIDLLEPVLGEGRVYLDVERPRSMRRLPNDPLFPNQWHLRNTSMPEADINAEPAWDAGYTGEGVILGILEGGIQSNHPDLAANYNATASQSGGSSSHGTAVAGVMGAVANNNLGVVGAAYDAEISKQYFGSSSTTAAAFGYRNDLNDLKNNSWGPPDNGRITYLSTVERNALEDAVANGRGGLGEIFTWAAGNGGTGDRVEYDPYASSRMTIAVGAIGDQDTRSSYNERGSSMLVVAHSSGNNRGITTTDSGSGYTSSFGGTSSASPLGGGVIGLMLDANPNLSWRDVQGVLVHSARINDPSNGLWVLNGAGHDVNYNYGYGAVEAPRAAATAVNWTTYGSEILVDSGVLNVGQALPDNNAAGITESFTVSQDVRIETIEVIVDVTTSTVGDLRIALTSPSGTEAILAKDRSDPNNNYNNYIFTSVRNWDERSAGTWELNISDRSAGDIATWNDWQLKIYANDGSGGPGLTLWADTLTAGGTGDFHVAHGTPNAPVYMGYSLSSGSTFIPQLNVTADLANPVLAASGNTDVDGAADFPVPIPVVASGLTVYFQAVQFGIKSNLLFQYIN